MSKVLFIPLQLSLGTAICLSASPLLAQISSDGTVNTQVNQNGSVAEITGGETRGGNLFHSFQEFSVQTGNGAFFNNAQNIQNIFSRVTGGNISNIDGAIRANGNASLFLINPAGIVFGENARLDIGGSFYGSTASSILFEDGEFSAVDNLEQPVLTINAPIGLGFRDEPGDIVNNSIANNGQGLAVNPGNTISLLGGDIRFNGGRVTTPRGIVNLGGLATAGIINLESNDTLVFPDDVAKADIALSDRAIIDLTSDGGGKITVNTNNLELTGGSLLLAGIGENLGNENAVAGAVEIEAQNLNFENDSAIVVSSFGQGNAGTVNIEAQNISFDGEWSGIYATLGLSRIATDEPVNDAAGSGGEITINTENSLLLTNGARISTNSVAQGNAGNINIEATGLVTFSGSGTTPVPAFGDNTVLTGINSQVQFEGKGNGGQIKLKTGSLELGNGGGILADNDGVTGDAGNIQINVRENFLTSPGFVLIQTSANNTQGNAGDINITANFYESNSLNVLADNLGQGDGGNINLNVQEIISLNENSLFQTGVKEGGIGNAGDIIITANSFVANNSDIVAKTEGQGNAGTIFINTNEAISLNNQSSISSEVTFSATGNGGDINITGEKLNLTNRSSIIANFQGQSVDQNNINTGGNININITGDITLNNDPENVISDNGNQILSQVGEGATGNAGNISINANGSFISNNKNEISTDSSGNGNSGNIQIITKESIEINDNSLIFANIGELGQGNAGKIIINTAEVFSLSESSVLSQIEDRAEGNAGNINITANTINVNNFGLISTNARGESSLGNAGNINLNGGTITINTGANVSALTENNNPGGNITLKGGNLELLSGGTIVTSTNSVGNAGNITVDITGDIEINGEGSISRPESAFELRETVLNDLQESTGLFATSVSGETGNGGNLTLKSQNLKLNNDARITAATKSGSGGNITLTIDETISLKNNSLISAEASANANGGSLNIDSQLIIAFSNGNNDILASAEEGTGGDINITTEALLGIQQRKNNPDLLTNDIDASSDFNLDGTVNINILSFDPIKGATELPQNVVEPQETAAQACKSDHNIAASNQLTIQGKGGTLADPIQPLDSADIIINGQIYNTVSIPAPVETAQGKIQPARGAIVTESGEVILTPYRTADAEERIPEKRSCG